MGQDTTRHINRMKNDLKRLVDDAEDALRRTADQAGEDANEWRSRMQDSVADAKSNLAALPHDGLQRLRVAGRAADGYVHANPWTVLAAAAGFGALIGMLIARR